MQNFKFLHEMTCPLDHKQFYDDYIAKNPKKCPKNVFLRTCKIYQCTKFHDPMTYIKTASSGKYKYTFNSCKNKKINNLTKPLFFYSLDQYEYTISSSYLL